jgi:hypothetical protein
VLSTTQQERLARNEAFFREVNERINDTADHLATASGEDKWEYLCECADPSCTERITLSRSEYEAVRADPRRFVLTPGHPNHEIERVVDADRERVVVEKEGLAGAVAAELDPR